MKKLLFSALAFAGLFATSTANAQLADGSIAPDFSFNDFNGVSQNLYTYLNQGKTVFIDVSAAWCSPCWNYHESGALDTLYKYHGPSGFTNVSSTTSDDVMVLFVEGQLSNTSAQLTGTTTAQTYAGYTQGDWVTGTLHPIIDLPNTTAGQAFLTGYEIGYFPTIYKICPNRTITEVGQLTATALYSSVSSCPAPASQSNDAALLSYTGNTKSCSDLDLEVMLQNNGTSALTACTITATVGGTTVATYNWTGNLATYGIDNVIIGQYTPTSTSETMTITVSTDDNLTNNVLTQVVGLANVATVPDITVKVATDAYGSETSWKIVNSSNVTVLTSPTYTNQTSSGTYTQTDITSTLTTDCFKLIVDDSYGDGFNSGYGDGYVQIWVGSTKIAEVTDFTGSEKTDAFQIETTAGINETTAISALSVYPNPATDVLNVSFEAMNADYTINIVDLQGRVISSAVYTGLNGSQTVKLPVGDIAKGSYIVSIRSNNGASSTQNVVIK